MSILCDEYQTSMKAVKINKESQLSILNSVTWFLMLPFSNAESQIIEVSRSQTILETQKLTLHQSCPFLDSKTQRDKWGEGGSRIQIIITIYVEGGMVTN